MKYRAIFSATAIGLLTAVGMPAINRAQDNDNPFAEQQLSDVQRQLAEQKKQLDEQKRQQLDRLRNTAAEIQGAAVAEAYAAADLKMRALKTRAQSASHGPRRPRHLTEINEQAAKYRDAESEQDKAAALDHLTEVIEKYFDDDMKIREEELASIEERVNKLKAQLERRLAKKEEIVDLQVKVAINEADGLGFISSPDDRVSPWATLPPVGARYSAPAGTVEYRVAPVPFAAPPVPFAPAPVAPQHYGTTTVVVAQPTPAMGGVGVRQPFAALQFGSEGDDVRKLQTALNEKLKPSPELDIDGDFGNATDAAVRTFQESHDLPATGIVDLVTWQAITATGASPAKASPVEVAK